MSEFIDKILRLDAISFGRVVGVAASLMPVDRRRNAKTRVSGGIRLLNRESELNDYLVAFGEIHQTKLMEFLPHIPFGEFGERGVVIVDWGCGQGVATSVAFDYLRTRPNAPEVMGVRLIELVEHALRRAEAIVSKYGMVAAGGLKTFVWESDALERICEGLPEGSAVLHLFSNILDVTAVDLDAVRAAVERMRKGHDTYVLTVGPDRETKTSSPSRLVDFLNAFRSPRLLHAFPNGGNGRIYGDWKYWPYAYCKCFGFAYAVPATEVPTPSATEPIAIAPPPPDPEDLFMYASVGMSEEIESLLEAGADVDHRNEKGATALYFAAKHGNVGAVEALLSAGADMEMPVRSTGLTPYLIAVKYERRDVIAVLVGAGCDRTARDARGRNAAEIVRAYGLDLKEDEL